QVAKTLYGHFLQKGHTVITSLKSKKIDLILMIHPNRHLRVCSYGIEDIQSYIALHPNTLLVHRVNTCDEPRGTNFENKMLLNANQLADYTVFVSAYLKDLFIKKGFDTKRPHSVIHTGPDEKIFNPNGRADWKQGEKLTIVTHHWSGNFMKGFDVYERLDLLLGTEPYRSLFEFTIIGNVPTGMDFKHTNIIPPLSGQELAHAIKQNHIYLSAARNEPAGNHYIEGMRCGLPALFLNSGSLPEYCAPCGVEFNLINFEEKLLEMKNEYPALRGKVSGCPYTGSRMSAQYISVFEELFAQRQQNPVPEPGLGTVIRQRLITDALTKLRRGKELFTRAYEHLR
ncbi:MAG: hypothetical protein HZC11_06155, partial [Nitrospirae bacterium]|nr:hypothetical protein [Nitrospirota bacterium]